MSSLPNQTRKPRSLNFLSLRRAPLGPMLMLKYIVFVSISMASLMTLPFGCGDPLVDGTYRGEPVGRVNALLQSYQPLQSYSEEDWVSVESQCLSQSDACLLSESSSACRLEQSQCIQETRAEISWMQRPSELSLAVLWLPISVERGENKVIEYLEEHDELPQSAIARTAPAQPFPYQGELILYQPPPADFFTPVDLTQQAHLTSASELTETPSALGILLAYLDDDQDQSYSRDDTLIGLTLDQGVVYSKLPNKLSSTSLKLLGVNAQPRAIASAVITRVNFPFCSAPEQWVLPPASSLPLTLSLMELQPWVLDEELERYFSCEAGVSPQCTSRDDLDEICAPSRGDSELCHQCFDQLVNDLCGRVMSQCLRGVDDHGDETCFAISEACQLRTNCFVFDTYCSWTPSPENDDDYDRECRPEDTAFCYQDTSCVIQTIYDEELLIDRLNQDELDTHEYVERRSPEAYQRCVSNGEYAQWIRSNPTCDHPLGLDLSDEGDGVSGDALNHETCAFKACELTYISCVGPECEESYINCVLMRDQ